MEKVAESSPLFEVLSADEVSCAITEYIDRRRPGRIPAGPYQVTMTTAIIDGKIDHVTMRFARNTADGAS